LSIKQEDQPNTKMEVSLTDLL